MPKNPGHVIADLVVVDDATLQHLGQLSNLQMVGVEGGVGWRKDPNQWSRHPGRAVVWGPGTELSKKYESKPI